MRTRLMVSAYLQNNGRVLLMRRALSRRLSPGMWAPVGGHIEPDELTDPTGACLREVAEETGISESAISHLSLRYLVNRLSKDEIRTQYVFIGRTTQRTVVNNGEGELHWVAMDRVGDLTPITTTTRFTLDHYMTTGGNANEIYAGTVRAEGSAPAIEWAVLSDWE